jgi:hypothetical protein
MGYKLDVERVISNGCSKINPKARISQLIETKAALKKTIKESIKLVERCRVFAGQKQTTANQIERYTQVEKKLIKCIGRLPFISLPNSQIIHNVFQYSDDVSSISGTNKIAEVIYDAIEKTATQALTILESDEASKAI